MSTTTSRRGTIGRLVLMVLSAMSFFVVTTPSAHAVESLQLTAGSGFFFVVDGERHSCTLGPLVTWVENGDTKYGGLTAGHCGRNGVPVTARRNGDVIGHITRNHTSGGMDIAVVQFLDPMYVQRSIIPAKDFADAVVGQKVVIHGDSTTVATGVVVGKYGEPSIEVTAHTEHGDSGGPVYGIDSEGKYSILGIVQGALDNGHAVVVSSQTIRAYIGPSVHLYGSR